MDDGNIIIEALNEEHLVSLVSSTITQSCYPKRPTNPFSAIVVTQEYEFDNTLLKLRGSTAEFYIQPIVSCVGDIDIMCTAKDALLVETDDPVFPHVSEQFVDIVRVFKIQQINEYPGIVRLLDVGEFRFSGESLKYEFVRKLPHCQKYLENSHDNIVEDPSFDLKFAGPAISIRPKTFPVKNPRRYCHDCMPEDIMNNEGQLISIDFVKSFSGYTWPAAAAEWKFRDRPHGWPSAMMIQNVVAGGCDVVSVIHPDFRFDGYMFRLSFSHAEVVLINSWSHVQQVVYHMLRYFAKRELINPKRGKFDKILSVYHIKTVMLWSCETQNKDFWEHYAIEICCKLLEKVLESLKQKTLPNYFIPKSNLFGLLRNETNRQEVLDKLEIFQTKGALSRWFLYNYVRISTDLNDAFAVECRKFLQLSGKNRTLDEHCASSENVHSHNLNRCHKQKVKQDCLYSVLRYSVRYRTFYWDRPYQLFVRRKTSAAVGYWFVEYVTAFQLLQLVKDMLSLLRYFIIPEWEFIVFDYIAKLYKQWEVHKFPSTYILLQPGRRYFITAQELMTGLGGHNSPDESQLLTKLSIHCLYKSMNAEDSIANQTTQETLMVYVAALHYTRKEYSIAIDLCLKVLDDQRRNRQGIRRYVDGRFLQFVDDIVNIRGFLALCRYSKCLYYGSDAEAEDLGHSNFTPEILAQHLLNLCRPANSKIPERMNESQTLADQCLVSLTKYKIKLFYIKMEEGTSPFTFYRSLSSQSTAEYIWTKEDRITLIELIQSLMVVSFEKLTLAFNIFRYDFGLGCVADIQLCMLFTHRCGTYDVSSRLLDILENMAVTSQEHRMNCQACTQTFSMALDPPVDLFLDDDCLSLMGFFLLVQHVRGPDPFRVSTHPKDVEATLNALRQHHANDNNTSKETV